MKHGCWLVAVVLVGCDPDLEGSRTVELGECTAPAGLDLPATVVTAVPGDCVPPLAGGLALVGTSAQWQALFTCAVELPGGLDLGAHQAAVIHVPCTPIDVRFVTETTTELVIGIYQRVSGACLGDAAVVALPRSAKPVRLARCQESCEGECPPVP